MWRWPALQEFPIPVPVSPHDRRINYRNPCVSQILQPNQPHTKGMLIL